jgi:uncharacterized membrane protein
VKLFSLFRKKRQFFSAEDTKQIVDCIRVAEKETSGEIRIFVEGRNPFVQTMDRAKEIFFDLKMNKTADRNAVLLYVAIDDKVVALFADEGIYKRVGAAYWDNAVKNMLSFFTADNISNGIEKCVLQIGETLKKEFPYNSNTDKNELPDEIVFGK